MNAPPRDVGEQGARPQDRAYGLPEVTLAGSIRRVPRPRRVRHLGDGEGGGQAEIAACAPHPETIALIRAAKAKGLRVVVVSDCNFTTLELRRLLEATIRPTRMPPSTMSSSPPPSGSRRPAACSSRCSTASARAAGTSSTSATTAGGYVAAKALGMNAAHLAHHGHEVEEVPAHADDRGEPADAFAARRARFRPRIAACSRRSLAEADRSRRSVMRRSVRSSTRSPRGPRRVRRAPRRRKKAKPVFLLRDGYLPFADRGGDHGRRHGAARLVEPFRVLRRVVLLRGGRPSATRRAVVRRRPLSRCRAAAAPQRGRGPRDRHGFANPISRRRRSAAR